MSASVWHARAVAGIDDQALPTPPLISRVDLRALIPGMDLWDLWPVRTRSGEVAEIAGGTLVMLLSAPTLPDPDDRHSVARIRLMHRVGAEWRDLGPLLPERLNPGSREWAGSAVLSDDDATVTLYFTAAGRRDEESISFEQRIFETSAPLSIVGGTPLLVGWTEAAECLVADRIVYSLEMAGGGAIGTIKAFRDPAWFRDPEDGDEYLLFTGSLAQSQSQWNGAIGIARRSEDRWKLLPPIITADGVNNELERPHIVMHEGRYLCFWSTQRKVFADDGPSGPNGLYGMVSERLLGPWRPLNGTGLVLANPPSAPNQAYSWLVLSDLTVLSFADMVGLAHDPQSVEQARKHFGGGPAPEVRLTISGDAAELA